MKKALVAGILGLAVTAVTSHGQNFGQTAFDNYNAAPYMPVKYALSNIPVGATPGAGVSDSGVHLDLFYFIGVTADPNAMTDLGLSVAINSTKQDGTAGANFGYIDGSSVVIPGYTSGPVTFMVRAWETTGPNGSATYANSNLRGQSFLWQEAAIAAGSVANPPPPAPFWSGLPGPNGGALVSIQLVPEPTTLALTGIGALTLLAFRRRA